MALGCNLTLYFVAFNGLSLVIYLMRIHEMLQSNSTLTSFGTYSINLHFCFTFFLLSPITTCSFSTITFH